MPISPRKLAANQENARRSTGPRTPEGKEKVRLNAVRHGLLAKEVIVPIGDEQENRSKFERLCNDLWQHYAPVGPVEEMLVEMIAICYWRLRRATRAEVGELTVGIYASAGSGAVVVFSGVAARLHQQVKEADPNFDFGTWLHTDRSMATLGWDVKQVGAYIKGLGPAERKAWLLQALEETMQSCLERERAQQARIDRHHQAAMVQRSIPGSGDTVDKILRYETTIQRQLHKTIAELEKLQSARRRRTSSPDSGPTQAA